MYIFCVKRTIEDVIHLKRQTCKKWSTKSTTKLEIMTVLDGEFFLQLFAQFPLGNYLRKRHISCQCLFFSQHQTPHTLLRLLKRNPFLFWLLFLRHVWTITLLSYLFSSYLIFSTATLSGSSWYQSYICTYVSTAILLRVVTL